MTKHIVLTSMLVISVVLIPGCDRSRTEAGGDIEFTFPPPPSENVSRIDVRLTNDKGVSHQSSVPTEGRSSSAVHFSNVESGTWSATIQAKSQAGDVLYSTEKSVEVQSGKYVTEHITLEPRGQGQTVVMSSWAHAEVYLSDLAPSRYENIMGGVGRDAAYWGNPMMLNGVRYSKGVVTHPEEMPGFVEYLLEGRYSRFKAKAAILDDAREGGRYDGNATFSVEADGRVIYSRRLDCHGTQWDDIDLDIRGTRVFRLRINNANGKTWSDHAAWLDARVM